MRASVDGNGTGRDGQQLGTIVGEENKRNRNHYDLRIQLEIDIDELKNIVKKLKIKMDEFDYQINPSQRRETL